jgi:mitochondrial cardiolipin hydrolase
MDAREIEEILSRTLDDRRLSRSEGQALDQVFRDLARDEDRVAVGRRAFELARAALEDPRDKEVLGWLEDLLKVLQRRPDHGAAIDAAEAHFSPGDDCPRRIVQLFSHARARVDVCVFTITDDRLAAAILDAHRRGVAVRIITDNEKVLDQGSDIPRLEAAGIPLRVDRTEYHMHHKFALFDDSLLLTGSYNWTRGAAAFNDENLVLTGDRRLIGAFATTFEKIWKRLE